MRILPAIVWMGLGLSAAQAQSNCIEPVSPPPLDGATASEEQLREALRQAREFVAQANLFESCLTAEAAAARQQAATDPAGQDAAPVRIAAVEKAKEKVSDDANRAMDTYKKAHANN